VNFANVTPRAAQVVGYVACLILSLILLVACRFRFAPTPECEGLEIAMVCALVPLCSPLAWTYFFCWLLPAWTAIASWYANPKLQQLTQAITVYGACLGGLLLASAITEQIDPTLQACGVTTIGATLLFLTLAFIRFHLPNHAEVDLGESSAVDLPDADFRRHPR
jgi:hypothetical protein